MGVQVLLLARVLDKLIAEQDEIETLEHRNTLSLAADITSVRLALAEGGGEEGGDAVNADLALDEAAAAAAKSAQMSVQRRAAEVHIHQMVIAELVRQERPVSRERAALLERAASRWLVLARNSEHELKWRAAQLKRASHGITRLRADRDKLNAILGPTEAQANKLSHELSKERARRATSERRTGEAEAVANKARAAAEAAKLQAIEVRALLAPMRVEVDETRVAIAEARRTEAVEIERRVEAERKKRHFEHSLAEEVEERTALDAALSAMREKRTEAEESASKYSALSRETILQLDQEKVQTAQLLSEVKSLRLNIAELLIERNAVANEAALAKVWAY
ncbi:hypothetical protein T492DRAFT_252147 [Pavlovales sp. CCMP2436]|nr:hypothetical protein T492DRAFT_252147 [Pavlovales sp. CCMP2436]